VFNTVWNSVEFCWSLSKYVPWWWPRRTQTCCIRNKKEMPLSIYNKVGTDSERGGYSFNLRYYSVIHLRKTTENLSMIHYSLKRLEQDIYEQKYKVLPACKHVWSVLGEYILSIPLYYLIRSVSSKYT